VAIGGTARFVVDQYNNRVSAYDRNGKRKWIISTGIRVIPVVSQSIGDKLIRAGEYADPVGLTVDGAGRLVIADPFGFDSTVLSPKDGH
jgi:hypothetical protein